MTRRPTKEPLIQQPSSKRVRIDLVAECFWRDGERLSVPPKAFLVLRQLVARPEQLMTRADLLDAVWPDTHVLDTVLNIAIKELRHALGDDAKQPRFIATVHRRGFRWVGPPINEQSSDNEDGLPAFVGREDILAELERCYTRANAGQRQMVFLAGDPASARAV